MHPKQLSIQDYTYELPDGRIATHPLSERDNSKLLTYFQGKIAERSFKSLPDLLKAGDMLVFNQSRVIQSRLFFTSEAGARIEVFCLQPAGQGLDIPEALRSKGSSEWICMVGNARKWKPDELLQLKIDGQENDFLTVSLIERQESVFKLQFNWPNSLSFAEVLEKTGSLPVPPYLKRMADKQDEVTYQTVYSADKGSVAAPTAGLHFSNAVLASLKAKGVETVFLTLHVGAGTFKPVKAAVMAGHEMHEEEISISEDCLVKLAACKGRVIAVGTTSLRTLESLYWTAVRLINQPASPFSLSVNQWDPYEYTGIFPTQRNAFALLLERMREEQVSSLKGKTGILIAPGYTIRTVDGLLTNFHQPQSTLLLLVAACIGQDWRKVYTYALEHDFRFLSYGDSSLLLFDNPAT